VRSLAEEYGFTDIDGACPNYAVLESAFEQAKKTYLAPMMDAARFAKVDWKLVPKADTQS
jgi:predicted transcriptional regulator